MPVPADWRVPTYNELESLLQHIVRGQKSIIILHLGNVSGNMET